MVVDPAFKAAGSPDGQRGEIDKDKTVHVSVTWPEACSLQGSSAASAQGIAETTVFPLMGNSRLFPQQVCTLEPHAVIGDIALLPNGGKRTASCIATTHLWGYRIGRSLLLRSLTPDQLALLRHVAAAKVAMTNNAAKLGARGAGVIGQILQGRNLRQMVVEQGKARKALNGPMLPEVGKAVAAKKPERKYKAC